MLAQTQLPQAVRNVLVVNRGDCECTRLCRELPQEQYHVTTVPTPDEAATATTESEFDLVLIDLDERRSESFELLKMIRNCQPSARVIMMTDYGDEELWLDVLNEGAADLVSKPVHRRDLERRL